MKFGTKVLHAGVHPDPSTGAVMTPIYQTSTFAQESPGVPRGGYEYSRTDNPTRTALQECLAELEEGKHALCFGSGSAALDTLLHLLAPGEHVLCGDDVYGGTFRLLNTVFKPLGIEFSQVDLTDLKVAASSFRKNTRLVWIETPTNPMLKIVDIAGLAELCKKQGSWLGVDNTFASPYFQRPLTLGADFVMHSATKYINGHSDVVHGCLVLKDSTHYERLKHFQNAIGGVPAPMDCFLVLRGLKTLHLRMERHAANAMKLADFLTKHSAIEKVYYPGLETHPGHAIARKQMSGFGGMISAVVKGGLAPSKRLLEKVKVFTLAESLGGVESLIEHPALMTHASIPKAQRESLGISEGLVRLSVGIEDVQDLIDDLTQALK